MLSRLSTIRRARRRGDVRLAQLDRLRRVARARRSVALTEPVWVGAPSLTRGRGEEERGRHHAA